MQMTDDELRNQKRNMWFFPLGTVGRDMVYCLISNFLLTFILFTRQLTPAQLGAITAIMVGARIFDALNDPIMGNIIERTRSRWGKFKPWLLAGIFLTSIDVYIVFNSNLTGWKFVWLFGIFYFFFSITYTMHDISYWGLIPALSSDASARDQLTSRATLFAGIGGTLASILIPVFTAGAFTLGGNAGAAYGRIALIVGILAPAFLLFTLVGVKEHREDMSTPAPKVSFGKIISTFKGNDQLVWISVIFLIQEVGSTLIGAGIGSTYIYVRYGYRGGLYSVFTTIGMAATAFLMIFYPAISKRTHRKPLMKYLAIISVFGYILMLISGFISSGSSLSFPMLTVGYMLSNLGQFGYYLIMMISIVNTVEYNEYKHGTRDEAIITSMRPFLTKMASAAVAAITSLGYILLGITSYTNEISSLESQAAQGLISDEQKLSQIEQVLTGVNSGSVTGLLLIMTLLPCTMLLISYFLYVKYYTLDEESYERICRELGR